MLILGITNSAGHTIGDHVIFTSLPENWHRNTGEKVVLLYDHWAWKHNPYVTRGESCDHKIDLWTLGYSYSPGVIVPSVAERTCQLLYEKGLRATKPRAILRHPCLYFNLDATPVPHQVAVHAKGVTNGAIPERVIQHIAKVYQTYNVIQVGSKSDPDTPFIDMRGVDIWESVRVISESAIFIGPLSGPANIALCYPRVTKKLLLLKYDHATLARIVPMKSDIADLHWLDPGAIYFNDSNEDIGITYSYTKI